MNTITQKQQQVLDFIAGHIQSEDYAPTMREISAHFEWSSPNAAQVHVRALERKGKLRKTRRGYVPCPNWQDGIEHLDGQPHQE